MIHHIFTANGAMTSPLLNIKACIMLLVSGLSQGPFLPPEIRPSNHWQIHADEKVGAVVAHVNVRDAQREGVVLTIQKSSGHHSVFSDTAINPFGEDGSSYFRVVNAGQGGVVRLAKSLKNFKVAIYNVLLLVFKPIQKNFSSEFFNV